ncbi:MAG: glycosyltransferase [Alphaproteobacteria bacterium]|nr:glycosyltransferase [Alphaproteobacteria bacterium]
MTWQKGIDLIADGAERLERLGVQIAVLGTGEQHLHDMLRSLAETHPNIAVRIGYDETLAHRMVAGSDVLLMPSRFEPCGLTQMYAMRYGTLPLVYRTGGLADTVTDCADIHAGTGFVFDKLDADTLIHGAERAVALYHSPDSWQKARVNAMTRDWSWAHAAKDYVKLYQGLLKAGA